MTTRPAWPQPAGRTLKAVETTANRAAALEAQAAALGLEMVADLASILEASAAQAAEIVKLNGVPLELRQLAASVEKESSSRAASMRQILRPLTTPAT